MESHAFAGSSTFTLPVANVRSVFQISEVERQLGKLKNDSKEHEMLRTTYERMLARGPGRFQVKPSGVPDMAILYETLPNFIDVLDDVRRNVALAHDSSDGLEVTPILLLGPPGVGKTHFAKELASLIGTGTSVVSMSSLTAGWLLSGSASQWKGAKPGKVFEALIDGEYANPVIVADEIDKASPSAQYDPLGALYSLLEHDTAHEFRDEFAEIAVDASQILWISTANEERTIPQPILNRMNVFEILPLTADQARRISGLLYATIRSTHDWGKRFDASPTDDFLDKMSGMAPREMRKALMTAFGNARLAGHCTLQIVDLPKGVNAKSKMGFVQ